MNSDSSSIPPAPQTALESDGSDVLYRIKHIGLKSGLDIFPGDLTLAIGPNNGGKSQFLKDLVSSIAYPTNPLTSLGSVEPDFPAGSKRLFEAITRDAPRDPSGHVILDAPSPDLDQQLPLRIPPSQLGLGPGQETNDLQTADIIKQTLGRHLVSYLTTERRLLLLKRQVNRQQNTEGPQTPIEAAFGAAPSVMEWVNQRVRAAFGTNIFLDATVFAAAEFRLGDSAKLSSDQREKRKQIQQLPQLDEQGDGIRSFCGLLIAIAAFRRPVVMIDEPEAFLHPPQAYLIGQAVAELRKYAQIFVATHSAEFLRGILSATTEPTVIRFSKSKSHFVTRKLSSENLKQIASDPVLSSVRVLDGLFYSGVAVTESDGDVVLYRSVMEQIDRSASIEFVNSYDKRLSAKIAAPFLAMGVSCAVIVDFDILRVRDDLKTLYESLGGTWSAIQGLHDSLVKEIEGTDSSNARLESALELIDDARRDIASHGDSASQLVWLRRRLSDVREKATVWGTLKSQGENGLATTAKPHFDSIIAKCEELGLFIVTAGERETWLIPQIPYTKNKRNWTKSALTYLSVNRLKDTHSLKMFVSAVREFCLVDSLGAP
jgi:hypothetical protein